MKKWIIAVLAAVLTAGMCISAAADTELVVFAAASMTETLNEIKVGETVKVVRINGEGPLKRRIMDMGITKGQEIYVRKVAPLGDPIEITVRGYELSIRKKKKKSIETE